MVLCIVLVQLPLKALFAALMSKGLGHTAFEGAVACDALCNLGLVAMACLLLPVVLLALLMLTALAGCLPCNNSAVGDDKHLGFECTALACLRSIYAGRFKDSSDLMRSLLSLNRPHGVIFCTA